jgi:hypothetical protein
MHGDVVLPAFELDCRDWLVASEADLPEELDGLPLLAVLSTAVFDPECFSSVSAVLTVGLVDEDDLGALGPRTGPVAAELADREGSEDGIRYVAATPDGRLAVVADFRISGVLDNELRDRIEALMTSFRWAA